MSYNYDMLGDFKPDDRQLHWQTFSHAYERYANASEHRFAADQANDAMNKAYKVVTAQPLVVGMLANDILEDLKPFKDAAGQYEMSAHRNLAAKANALLDRVDAVKENLDTNGLAAIFRKTGKQKYFELGIISDSMKREDVREVFLQLDFLVTNHRADPEIIEPFIKTIRWAAQYDLSKAILQCHDAWTKDGTHEELVYEAAQIEYQLVTNHLAYIDRGAAQARLQSIIASPRIDETLKEEAKNFIRGIDTLASFKPKTKKAPAPTAENELIKDASKSWNNAVLKTTQHDAEDIIEEMEASLIAAEFCMDSHPVQTRELLMRMLHYKISSDIPALQEQIDALRQDAFDLKTKIDASHSLSSTSYLQTINKLTTQAA